MKLILIFLASLFTATPSLALTIFCEGEKEIISLESFDKNNDIIFLGLPVSAKRVDPQTHRKYLIKYNVIKPYKGIPKLTANINIIRFLSHNTDPKYLTGEKAWIIAANKADDEIVQISPQHCKTRGFSESDLDKYFPEALTTQKFNSYFLNLIIILSTLLLATVLYIIYRKQKINE